MANRAMSLAALTAALVFLVPLAAAQLVFLPPDHMPAGSICTEAQVGDVNGDLVPDVVVIETVPFVTPLLLHEYLGQGDGTFVPVTIDLGMWARHLRMADTDGDETLDLVLCTGTGPAWDFGVLPGDGLGGFGPFQDSADGQGLRLFELFDLDQDGVLDAVGMREGAPVLDIAILRGDGAGGFTSWQTLPFYGLPEPFGLPPLLACGDLDEDGEPDLVDCTEHELRVYLGTGGGVLSQVPIVISYPTMKPRCVRLEDVDADGHLDLAFTATDPDLGGAVFIARGHGDATFEPPTIHPFEGWFPGEFAMGDLDGDGDPDVLTKTSFPAEDISIVGLVNAGDGSFAPGLALTAPQPIEDFVPQLADLDADGRLDLVSSLPVSGGGSRMVVALNRTYAPGGPMQDLGAALQGTAGWPIVLVEGSLTPSVDSTLSLWNGRSDAWLWAVVGWAAPFVPFRGGILVPQPDLVLPLGATPVGGEASWEFRAPATLSGTELYLQLWFADAGAVQGLAATTGVRLAFP
ncbi:MAG: FG-GAP repeat domain-containing protein [Planctomycetota bacterium]|jgi:hypothetical protein